MDCGFRRPEPWFVRFFNGLVGPKIRVLGSELAGDIAAIGKNVKQLRVGDPVFGYSDRFGAHAEYICLPETGLVAAKPANLTYDEAAAICDGGFNALACLRAAKTQSGQKLLIYGASGAIGSAAVQLAKYFGADVTGVTSTRHLDLVSSLGADAVIDYTRQDFTETGDTYDVVIDAVGKKTFARAQGVLTQGGVFVTTDLGARYRNVLDSLWTSRFGSKKAKIPIPRATRDDIDFLGELAEAGTFRPVIDRRYALTDIVEAYRYVETERKTGNVILTFDQDDDAG